MYDNARYDYPAFGTFISPDTIVPDPGMVIDYNRFLYTRGNPLRYRDPDGHCPKPPKSRGPTICIAMFIKPPEVLIGPLTGGGDDRGFSTDSDPRKSRAYVWVSLNSNEVELYANPTTFLRPAFTVPNAIIPDDPMPRGVTHVPEEWTPVGPSDANSVVVTRRSTVYSQTIHVSLDLVLAGLPIWASPHINAEILLYTNREGQWEALWDRDGYPWAEANYYDGEGNVQIIFRDPAVRGEISDLAAIEEDMNLIKRLHVHIMRRGKEMGAPVRSQNLYPPSQDNMPIIY